MVNIVVEMENVLMVFVIVIWDFLELIVV